jgi:hypothetical protein
MRTALLLASSALPLALPFAINAPQPPTLNRGGLSDVRMVAELIRTEEAKPQLGATLPDCPSTAWSEVLDIKQWQETYKAEDDVACPVEVHATPEDNAMGKEYFVQRREEIQEMLTKHGTIWFRGFDLTKDPDGFREFWESLQLNPCLDPIHSSGLRKFLSKKVILSWALPQHTAMILANQPPAIANQPLAAPCVSGRHLRGGEQAVTRQALHWAAPGVDVQKDGDSGCVCVLPACNRLGRRILYC